jgi:hypothetical protein
MKQETQKQQVSMKVNQANLVKGLKYSFTNKTTVLGELMQNARRAGATQVAFEFDADKKQLVVRDDGCGIDSMETLLTVAESGWDAKTVTEEHPFGIGFLSALFACDYLSIYSKGGHISVLTDDILSFNPVSVTEVLAWNGVTEITLSDVELTESAIKDALKTLARGFSIPVIYNGEELARPMAINSGLHFIKSDIGSIYLSGLKTPSSSDNKDFEVFLQGQPIYRSRLHIHNGEHHVIHLDSSSFYARLPDRERLINESEVVAEINRALSKEIEKRLISMKKSLTEQEFVSFYSIMKGWGLSSLLNDVSFVPSNVLWEMTDVPNCNTDAFGSFQEQVNCALSRENIEVRGVVTVSDDISDEGAARYLFAQQRNHLLYSGGLDQRHWLNTLVRSLDGEELTIKAINESHRSCFKGEWVWVTVCFCDAITIQIGKDQVVITDFSLYTGQSSKDDIVYVVNGDDSGDVLKQVSTYSSEFDDFQETLWESDTSAFSSFVVANTSKNTAEAIKRLLPDFSGCPSLYGEQFLLTLDNMGKVATVISMA